MRLPPNVSAGRAYGASAGRIAAAGQITNPFLFPVAPVINALNQAGQQTSLQNAPVLSPQELSNSLTGQPSSLPPAPPPSPLDAAMAWVQSPTGMYVVGGGLVLVAATAIGIAVMNHNKPKTSSHRARANPSRRHGRRRRSRR